jgi:hypothetical protein
MKEGYFIENSTYEIKEIMSALYKSWSLKSSTKWSEDNPAAGQCGVTALVVNDLLGGEIKKTKLQNGWHFYNVLNGTRYDFTESQFTETVEYMDQSSSREEAFSDTNDSQYSYLKQQFYLYLHRNNYEK